MKYGDEDELEFETRDLKPFIGKKILNILGLEVGKSRLVINFTDGSWLGFFNWQACCEWIKLDEFNHNHTCRSDEDIINNICSEPLLEITESKSPEFDWSGDGSGCDGILQYYVYNFKRKKIHLNLRSRCDSYHGMYNEVSLMGEIF